MDRNKRMSKRLTVSYQASFAAGGVSTEGVVRQISDGGLMYCCDAEIELGTQGAFTIKVFDGKPSLALSGVLRYRLYDSRNRGGCVKYGVCFVELDNAQKETISEVIRFTTIRQRYMPKPALIDDTDPAE